LTTIPAGIGILAVVATPVPTTVADADFCLLLEDVQDPGNVGSMLRSYDYAAEVGRLDVAERGLVERQSDAFEGLARWAAFWQRWVGAAFLRGYREAAKAPFATTPEETAQLLPAYLLEKALYEVAYELGSRPELVDVPLRGIRTILEWETV